MTLKRLLALGAAGLALSLTGCSEDASPSADPPPSSASDTPASTDPPPTASASESPWESKYTDSELAAYDAALKRYETYQVVSEPIWAQGKATPEAEALIKRFWAGWQPIVDLLRGYESGGIRREGIPELLWARPTRIKLDDEGGGSISVHSCIDYTGVRGFQGGSELPGGSDRPQNVMFEIAGYADPGPDVRWLILTQSNPQGKDPCESTP